MSRRVVYVVGTLQTGGIERSVVDWCIYLKTHTDWEPTVICLLKRSGPFLSLLSDHKIPVLECGVHRLGFVFRFSSLLQRINPAVVHSQVAFSMPWQVVGILMSGRRKIIFTQQNEYQNWNPVAARLRLKIYFYIFFRFIDYYTCVSIRVRDSLCRLISFDETDFLIIPNSVDVSCFVKDSSLRAVQRRQLGFESDTFVIGMVARFSLQKGHRYLIDAVRILKERKVSCKVLLVGVGDLEPKIRDLVSLYNLQEYVVFYGPTKEVNHVLQVMDCFILTSLWEGMPLALLEGMAAGLPVIGTDVAGTKELIMNGVNGFLIPSKDPLAIADAIQGMQSTDLNVREEMARNGSLFVRERYSVEANMRSYLKLYE